MGATESRSDEKVFETPQYLKYSHLHRDPRSPADGRTPLCSGSNQVVDPRSPSAMFERTPIFEIPEPFDFDKFSGLEPISPNVAKFENRGFDKTPTTSLSTVRSKSMLEKSENVVHDESGNETENIESKNEEEVELSAGNLADSLQNENISSNKSSANRKKSRRHTLQSTDGNRIKSGYRRSFRLSQENRVINTKKLEFSQHYSSPTNRSPLATRNFVRLQESPSVSSYTKKKIEKQVTIPAKFKEQVLYNENSSSDKENLLPYRRLSYV